MDTDTPTMSGLLICDKPAGVTSRDCVNQVERLLRSRYPKPLRIPKVGHAGTLDPLATGVLVIGIGQGVRLVPYIQQTVKEYEASFRLGWWSETGDLGGELQREETPYVPLPNEVEAAAVALTGEIVQVPPSTSAIKVGGKKAYKYAHQGIAVEVPPRKVQVESISIDRYLYPDVDMSIRCGSGTYIRTLGMDLAIRCQTRGVMTRLRRIRIGPFAIEDGVSLDELTMESLDRRLLPLAIGVAHLPRLELSGQQINQVCSGLKINESEIAEASGLAAAEAVAIDGHGDLRAICRKAANSWCPYRVFHHRVS